MNDELQNDYNSYGRPYQTSECFCNGSEIRIQMQGLIANELKGDHCELEAIIESGTYVENMPHNIEQAYSLSSQAYILLNCF